MNIVKFVFAFTAHFYVISSLVLISFGSAGKLAGCQQKSTGLVKLFPAFELGCQLGKN
jgi:hypothetical protein